MHLSEHHSIMCASLMHYLSCSLLHVGLLPSQYSDLELLYYTVPWFWFFCLWILIISTVVLLCCYANCGSSVTFFVMHPCQAWMSLYYKSLMKRVCILTHSPLFSCFICFVELTALKIMLVEPSKVSRYVILTFLNSALTHYICLKVYLAKRLLHLW